MKNKKLIIFLIVLLSVTAIALVIIMFSMINGKFKFLNIRLNHKTSNELVIDNVYDISFKKIDIDSDSSEVYIKKSNDNKTRIVIYGDKDSVSVNIINDELEITSKNKSCIGFCFNNTIAKIEIYLPSEYENLIKIKNKYGDIKVDNFKNSTIHVDEDCGDVEIHSASAVNINNDYGNIILGDIESANIKEACGDIKIQSIKEVIAENSYGNIEIENVSGYLDLSNDCGDIKIENLILTKNSKIKNDYGDIKIGTTNGIYIDAKTDLGNVKITNNYHKSDINLTIENDCGDIKVSN